MGRTRMWSHLHISEAKWIPWWRIKKSDPKSYKCIWEAPPAPMEWERYQIGHLFHRTTILTTLLYTSESWTPYRPHVNQLDVFHESCLLRICSYTLDDNMPNAYLLIECNIVETESSLIQSKHRWAGHNARMSDDRIAKVLRYSQLNSG